MIDVIFAIKFIHLIATGVVLGGWICLILFMLLAHRSGNTAVVALTSQFVVRAEFLVMAPAFALQPISGFPLSYAIGLAPFSEFWIDVSLVLYVGIIVCWLGAVRLERRIRAVTRQAALDAAPLPTAYRPLFRLWCVFAVPLVLGMIAVDAVMVWQPRLD